MLQVSDQKTYNIFSSIYAIGHYSIWPILSINLMGHAFRAKMNFIRAYSIWKCMVQFYHDIYKIFFEHTIMQSQLKPHFRTSNFAKQIHSRTWKHSFGGACATFHMWKEPSLKRFSKWKFALIELPPPLGESSEIRWLLVFKMNQSEYNFVFGSVFIVSILLWWVNRNDWLSTTKT